MAGNYSAKFPWSAEQYAPTTIKIVDAYGKTIAYVHKGSADSAKDNAELILKAVEAWTQKP